MSDTIELSSQAAHVEAMLRTMRLRLRLHAQVDGDDRRADEIDAHELALRSAARACATRGAAMPMLWLRDRLLLTATEERVIWLLLAHELDAPARQIVRELNTETVADATLDAIRRVVYGSAVDPRAGTELAPEGTLRRLGLIERTDGDDRCPEHRQTFGLARRVLALALDNASLDPALDGIAALPGPGLPRAQLVGSREVFDHLHAVVGQAPGLVVLTARSGAGRLSPSCLPGERGSTRCRSTAGRSPRPARSPSASCARSLASASCSAACRWCVTSTRWSAPARHRIVSI